MQQRPRVGVVRGGEQRLGRGALDDPAEIHDGNPVREVLDHPEIVADEQAGEAQVGAQLHEQVEDLCLDGDVERGHRFVAHEELRLHRESARDTDALALSARELVRKASLAIGVEADPDHQVIDMIVECGGRDEAVHLGGLGDDVSDPHARIERRKGVLKDHLDLDLPHAAGELVRIGLQAFVRRGDTDADEHIVRYCNRNGSRFTRREFSEYRPRWRSTLAATYRDRYRVVVPKCQTCSPNILTQLNVWEHFDVAGWGPSSFECLHLGIETAKLAFADRRNHCGDPDFSAVPYERLASKDYAAALAKRIDPVRAQPERPGDEPDDGRRGGTTHLTVVDEERNAVAMTLTLGPDFGSMHVVPGTGIILNNEGVFFDLDPPGGPNFPAAGKRVQHDMSPTLVFKDDALFLALGTPGGQGITQTTPQVISKVIDHGLGLQAAIESDRYRYFGAGRVRPGEGIPPAVRDRLREAGHEVLPPSAPPIWAGGFHAVMVEPDTGTLAGGADPRRGGLAVAY